MIKSYENTNNVSEAVPISWHEKALYF